jgi:hypothetical protein
VTKIQPFSTVGVGWSVTVASSATAQRKVSLWVRTNNAIADFSVTLNADSETTSIGNQAPTGGTNYDYYRVDAYIYGSGTATFRMTNTVGTEIGVMGAAVYE